MYMTTDRRPRIPTELAEKIDGLREDRTFESYIRDVLEDHVQHRLGDARVEGELGERRHTYTDVEGAGLDVYRDNGEWHQHDGMIAYFVVADEGYEPVGIYLDEPELRALRDLCTELLGEI